MADLRTAGVLLAILLVTAVARAHEVMGSVIYVDAGHTRLQLEVEIPYDELSLALAQPTAPGVVARPADPAVLLAYVLAHLSVRSPAGAPFALGAELRDDVLHDQRNWLRVVLEATPPEGASPRDFLLHTDLVNHRVSSHRVFVFLRSDPGGSEVPTKPRYLDTLHYQRHDTRVSLGEASLQRAFARFAELGAEHIAEGYDHQAFLFTLLWPVGLTVGARGRWSGPRSTRSTGRAVLVLVSAFTLGHSLTLALSALRGPLLPAQLVESVIALSVVVSAVHALVPLFPRREAAVALVFGLVHGLGLAQALDGVGVDTGTLLASLTGFNLGVELMQGVLLLVALPCLQFAARTRVGPALRIAGASVSLVAALLWLGERAFGLTLGAV